MTETPKQMADRLTKEGKKVLNLIIKQVYFDDILAGKKKKEYRLVKETTYRKLVKLEPDGHTFIFDENEHLIPIHYDYLLLFVGYSKNRDSMLVEVTGAEEEFFHDDKGEVIKIYAEDNPEDYDIPSQIAYSLGKVVSVERKK